MITFQQLGLWGRLGNQLWEYAALLGIAADLGYDVAIPPPDQHQLASAFAITAPVLRRRDRRRIRRVYTEPTIGWSPQYRHILDGTDLRGYFQSPRYFPPVDVLRRELEFHGPIERAAREAEQALREPRDVVLVGVTVRRGDYLVHPEQFVDLWQTGFYGRARAQLRDLVASRDPRATLRFLVSSDDPAWCREHLDGADHLVLDERQGLDDVEQLALLARCDHLIIANSSYSWWAAWLRDQRDPDGLTLAAARWWGDACAYPESSRDPLPAHWLELD